MSSHRSKETIERDREEIREGSQTVRRHLMAIFERNLKPADPTQDLGDLIEEGFRKRFASGD